jgi:hypothetical protein
VVGHFDLFTRSFDLFTRSVIGTKLPTTHLPLFTQRTPSRIDALGFTQRTPSRIDALG